MKYPNLRRWHLVSFLVLLVLLGFGKWRLNNPPLSSQDLVLRSDLGQVSCLYIYGYGRRWKRLTGLGEYEYMVVKDTAVFPQLAATLRSTSRQVAPGDMYSNVVALGLALKDVKTGAPKPKYYYYCHGPAGGFVRDSNDPIHGDLVMPPQFIPRFEAVIARLAQRAKAKGHHPEVMLSAHPQLASPFGLNHWGIYDNDPRFD